ncbi:MAG: aldo/keto reductase [Gemmatimonadetes bacterium]|nr:aldo/keto reductase [Gemmatimonadota bacterium]MYA77401.1 aldo/keto reductase [Gemmatimonadota bacterium]MYG16389.1 aldo/keto reductase [Gemmatimonadota bacterium]MYH17622.1 aldo/keto reductase [Gemmatimonadota bacterium]MYK98634.1 aldo/keto reductase [Gemmatimonadota bacterium]
MRHRILGKTGIRVSEIGMGGLFVSSHGSDRTEGIRAVRRGLELGINYIDTAPSYRDSEEVMGLALDGVTQPFILSTKLGGRPQPFDPRDPDQLRRSVETSLELLKRDEIDILMIHEPDRPGQYDWFADWERFHGPVCELLEALKSEGVIRYTGLGGTTAYTLPAIMATGAYDVVLTAFNYSLLWQEAVHAVLPEAEKQHMGVVVGSPLQQGALSACFTEQVERGAPWLSPPRRTQFKRLYALVEELDMPLPELAIRWVLSNPAVSTVLSGSRSVEEVEQNVGYVASGPLPAAVLDLVQEIADMVPFRPFEEPFGLPFTRVYRGPGLAR